MAHLKGRHTHISYFGGDTRYRSRKLSATADEDRASLIAEALHELKGVEVIYAIRCPGGLIKIGHTTDLQNRRRQFDTDPAAILAVKPGTYDDEQETHAALRESCARGKEYYHPTPEVLGFVNAIRDGYGLGPIA